VIDDDTIAQAQVDEHDEPMLCRCCGYWAATIDDLCEACDASAQEADHYARLAVDLHAELLNELVG
jgi:predicted amidophosphoribosyltransferase